MTAPRPVQRAPRRNVRVRCNIGLEGVDVTGYIADLSVSGVRARVPRRTVADRPPDVGARTSVAFVLPDRNELVRATIEIVRVMTDDRDVTGQAAIGIGARFQDLPAATQELLASFVREFRYTVVVVDDDSTVVRGLSKMLEPEYRVVGCTSADEALRALKTEEVAVLLTDLNMPGVDGRELLKGVSEALPESQLSRIVLTGHPEHEVADLILRGDIFQRVLKPWKPGELQQVIRRGVDLYAAATDRNRLDHELAEANERLAVENAYLKKRLTSLEGFQHIVGDSPELRDVLGQVARVLATDVRVNIEGETGTGKELVARALHLGGPRANRAFLALNCGGVTESLQHSMLFGHEKGAFTGADRRIPGVFEQADGGTLFLDEVSELAPSTQTALLRALDRSEVTPVGATEPIKVDVRIVSASNRDLAEEVGAGRFRRDLYHRLLVMTVRLPPLRKRSGDIPVLAHHFLELFCTRYRKKIRGFSPGALRALEQYPWPGNVRELEHEVERLVAITDDGHRIAASAMSRELMQGASGRGAGLDSGHVTVPIGKTFDDTLEQVERQLVEDALRKSNGVVARAARRLGMERTRLLRISRKHRSRPG